MSQVVAARTIGPAARPIRLRETRVAEAASWPVWPNYPVVPGGPGGRGLVLGRFIRPVPGYAPSYPVGPSMAARETPAGPGSRSGHFESLYPRVQAMPYFVGEYRAARVPHVTFGPPWIYHPPAAPRFAGLGFALPAEVQAAVGRAREHVGTLAQEGGCAAVEAVAKDVVRLCPQEVSNLMAGRITLAGAAGAAIGALGVWWWLRRR